MALDIKRSAAADTFTFQLLDGADEPLFDDDGKPVKVTVYGPGSKPFAKAKSAQENRIVQRLQRKGRTDQSPEEKAKQTAEFLADVTVEFSNLDYEGKTGRDLAIAVYSDTSIGFIADQVHKAAHDWANFSTGSAKS